MNWYKTRDKIAGSTHRGQELQSKKYVRMTEAQAAAHNRGSEEGKAKLTKGQPKKAEECQFASDWADWQQEKAEAKEAKSTGGKQ